MAGGLTRVQNSAFLFIHLLTFLRKLCIFFLGWSKDPGPSTGEEVPRFFCGEMKHIEDSVEATGKLSKQISSFIRNHFDEFLAFDDVKIYYDNGQVEVSRLLSSVFNALLPNPIFRKVMPTDYKLFQVADFICTMELVSLKLENSLFSKSEMTFFGNKRDLKQNYLKALKKKEWN